MANETQHGSFGSDQRNFIRMLKAQPNQHTKGELASLAQSMEAGVDTVDIGPDPEENLFVPAGYTYFGQFVDHDLTLDSKSTFDGNNHPTNQRTPRFDLDCVYGQGPLDDPHMYEADGVHMKLGRVLDAAADRKDLFRETIGGKNRARIGDHRNDENSIVSQIQAGFIRFHNKVADKLKKSDPSLTGAVWFNASRNEVRWTYQRTLVEDYLKRVIDKNVIEAFETTRKPNARGASTIATAFALYRPENRAALPLEFAGAAYRFGHSLVRNGYVLGDDGTNLNKFIIFDGNMDENSLIGFQPLIDSHFINDWRRFFPDSSEEGKKGVPLPGGKGGNNEQNIGDDDVPGTPRLQWAYRLDPMIANPLRMLPVVVADDPPPSLLVRNLWRGAAFQLPFGQEFETALKLPKLDPKYFCFRQELQRDATDSKQYQFVKVDAKMIKNTPLWFYILAEAQKPTVDALKGKPVFNEDDLLENAGATGTQLGPVGGRILLEVFNGLLDSDPDSYRNHPDAATWKPMVKKCRVWDILNF
jgi:hypothetical protein